jgi:hypothetical protein
MIEELRNKMFEIEEKNEEMRETIKKLLHKKSNEEKFKAE